ncbi:MAG: hypothetical protein AABZ39_02930 [Spirochaetota bacterium]
MKTTVLFITFSISNLFSFPDAIVSTNELISQDYSILDLQMADIDSNGTIDIIAVAQIKNEINEKRCLLLYTGTDNYYLKKVENSNAIHLSDEDGMLGDPFRGIKITNGSIVLSFYGGSYWRWALSFQFRFKEDNWYLIRYDLNNLSSVNSEGFEESYDFLSKKMKRIDTDKNKKRKEIWRSLENKKLVSISDFDIYNKGKYLK